MASTIRLIQPSTGRERPAYEGFSWTTLFFGPFPSLLRGHLWAFFVLVVAGVFTMCISQVFAAFFINVWHRRWLEKKGYVSIMRHASDIAARPFVLNVTQNN